MGTRRRPPAIRPPAYASASAPRVRPLQKALRLGWSAILDALSIRCRPAQPLPLQLPHAVCSGPRSGALVLRPVLLCDPPDGRSALSLPLPSRTAAPPAVRASRPIRRARISGPPRYFVGLHAQACAPLLRLPGSLSRGLLPARASPCCVQSSNGRTPTASSAHDGRPPRPCGLLCVYHRSGILR